VPLNSAPHGSRYDLYYDEILDIHGVSNLRFALFFSLYCALKAREEY